MVFNVPYSGFFMRRGSKKSRSVKKRKNRLAALQRFQCCGAKVGKTKAAASPAAFLISVRSALRSRTSPEQVPGLALEAMNAGPHGSGRNRRARADVIAGRGEARGENF